MGRWLKILIVGLALAAIAIGGDMQPVSYQDMSGGMNVQTSKLKLPLTQAVEAYNFSLATGSPVKRTGYTAITDTIAGNDDALMGIYGLKRRNGHQYLLKLIADSADQWTNLHVGTLDADSEAAQYLYRTGQFEFLTWRDYAIVCDGYNFPVMTNGEVTRSMHIPAPGEIQIEVLDTDTSRSALNGTYRWAILAYEPCDTTNMPCSGQSGEAWAKCITPYISYVTPPVSVYRKQVAIHLFPAHIADSVCDDPLPLKFFVCRTKANRTDLLVDDTLWIAGEYFPLSGGINDSFWVLVDDSFTVERSISETYIVVDSGTDSTAGYGHLGDGFNLERFDYTRSGGRNIFFDSLHYPGSPRFLKDTVVGGFMGSQLYIYGGGVSGVNLYSMTFYDTVFNIESDTSMNMPVKWQLGDSTMIIVSLPQIPLSIADNCIRRIYRGSTGETGTSDSISAVHLIGEIKGQDSTFLDTVVAVYLNDYPDLYPEFDPPGKTFRFAGMLFWDDRLYGWGDAGGPSNLYYSKPDTATFGAFDYISLGPDDGDRIVTGRADRNRLLMYKNRSRHEIYEYASGNVTKTSPPYMVGGEGCIAAKSMVTWRGSRIYLGPYGVVLEMGAQFLDQGNTVDTISQNIKPILDSWSTAEKAKAVGQIIDDNTYMLSFYEKDTTLVCWLDRPGRPWAIYGGFSFRSGTFYRDDDDYSFELPDQFVFCRDSSDRVYQWDTTRANNGTAFAARYKSGVFGYSPDLFDLYSVLISVDHYDGDGVLRLTLYNVEGDSLYVDSIFTDWVVGGGSLPDWRTKMRSQGRGKMEHGWQFAVTAESSVDSVAIEALTFYLKFMGKSTLE